MGEEAAANVLFLVVNSLAKNGHNKIQLDENSKETAKTISELTTKIQGSVNGTIKILK